MKTGSGDPGLRFRYWDRARVALIWVGYSPIRATPQPLRPAAATRSAAAHPPGPDDAGPRCLQVALLARWLGPTLKGQPPATGSVPRVDAQPRLRARRSGACQRGGCGPRTHVAGTPSCSTSAQVLAQRRAQSLAHSSGTHACPPDSSRDESPGTSRHVTSRMAAPPASGKEGLRGGNELDQRRGARGSATTLAGSLTRRLIPAGVMVPLGLRRPVALVTNRPELAERVTVRLDDAPGHVLPEQLQKTPVGRGSLRTPASGRRRRCSTGPARPCAAGRGPALEPRPR